MERIKPRTLSGFMELLPQEQARMERFMQTLRESYSLYGFAPLDTPIIEAAEVLLAKGGGETEKQIYRFTKGDTDLALRFDLTVPLAKYVALNYGKLAFPFRRFQIGKVYRGERAQRGRFREFYQADVDIIGDGSLDIICEAEILAVIYNTFTALGLKKFCVRINNRKLLNGFFAMLGLTGLSAEILRTVDKLEKIGKDKVHELLAEMGVSDEGADEILHFVSFAGLGDDALKLLETYAGKNDTFDEGLQEMRSVLGYLPDFGVPEENYVVDLSIARGLDYYTGTVYETTMTDHPGIGSICSGGRYENLAGYYTDKKLPGVGISIGVTRLFYVLNEQGLLSDEAVSAPADALIIPMTDDLSAAVSTATALRGAGIRTQIYTEKKKFKAKLSYCDKQDIPFAVLIGEDEIAANTVSVKNMRSGEQETLPVPDAIEKIKAELTRRAAFPVIKENND